MPRIKGPTRPPIARSWQNESERERRHYVPAEGPSITPLRMVNFRISHPRAARTFWSDPYPGCSPMQEMQDD